MVPDASFSRNGADGVTPVRRQRHPVGSAQGVLYDMQKDSPTRGETQVLYAGERSPLVIAIPPGVAHGYRVLGTQPAGLLYHTTEHYDPADPDEERIPFDDPAIGFDWRTKNR